MPMVDRQFIRFDPISALPEAKLLKNSACSIEGLDVAESTNVDVGFDGMISDAIVERDLMARMEEKDSA
jgi:hypothetical protein